MITIYVCGDRDRVWRVASHCAAQFGPYAYEPACYSWALIRNDFGVTRLSSSQPDPLPDLRVNACKRVYTRDFLVGEVKVGSVLQTAMFDVPAYSEPIGESPYVWLWNAALPSYLPDDIVRSLHRQYKTLAASRQRHKRRMR